MTQIPDPYDTAPQTPSAVPVLGYAAPIYGVSASGSAWRDGAILVVHKASQLPHACVKCGGPPEKLLKRNMVWYPPLAYLGLLAGLLPFAIVAVIMQKKATVMVPMCSEHLKSRTKFIFIALAVGLLGLAIAIVGPMLTNQYLLILLGTIVFIVGLMIRQTVASPLRPKKIDNQYAYLKGAGEIYLSQLPDLHTAVSQYAQ